MVDWIDIAEDVSEANVYIYYNLEIEKHAPYLLDHDKIKSMRYIINREIDSERVDEIVSYQEKHYNKRNRYDYDSMIVFGTINNGDYFILDGQHRLCSCLYLDNQNSIKLNLCFYTFDTREELHNKYKIANSAQQVGEMYLSIEQESRKIFELVEKIISARYPECIREKGKYLQYMKNGCIANSLYSKKHILDRFNDPRQSIEQRANMISNILINYNEGEFKRLIQNPSKMKKIYKLDRTTIGEKNIQQCEKKGSFYMGFVQEKFGMFIEEAVEADAKRVMIDL